MVCSQLILCHGTWAADHEIFAPGRLRKGNDVPDTLAVQHRGYQAIPAKGEACVRRTATAESFEEVGEFRDARWGHLVCVSSVHDHLQTSWRAWL